MNTVNLARIVAAIEATKKITFPGHAQNYWVETLIQRTTEPKGSRYPETTPEALEDAIKQADWEGFVHDNVAPTCAAFMAALPGRLGMIPMEKLPDGAPVYLLDFKGTGQWDLVAAGGAVGPKVAYSSIILGMEGDEEVVYTIHPGEPAPFNPVTSDKLGPNLLSRQTDFGRGKRIDLMLSEANELGFAFAKIE